MPWAERAAQLRRVLEGGVTMVYDVASDVRHTSDLARAALAGEIEAPTILYAALFAGSAFFTDPRVVATSRGYQPDDAPWNRAIAAGVDSLTRAGEPLPMIHSELEVLVSGAGLTPLEAITAATRGSARAIGVDDVRGTVERGKVADLLIVDAAPSRDIRHTRRIRYVIKDGRIVHTARGGGQPWG